MPKLWIPDSTQYPDVDNLYDMAYAMQEQIIAMPTRELRIVSAHRAIKTASEMFDQLEEQQRSVSLYAGRVLLGANTCDPEFAYDIGVRGLLDDIQYIELAGMPLGLSLVIDTHETFAPHDPTSREPTNAFLCAPIMAVEYIESAA